MPMLEVIDKGSCTDTHPVPLLFVHGGCHAAWCWDEHFLDYFARHGFRAVAVSWRCHGHSAASKPLQSCSVADYVEDVRCAADDLGGQPIVVGHSLGGFVVQRYLEIHPAPAGVLLASLPPRTGVIFSALAVWRRHPWIGFRANTFGQSHDVFNTPALAREFLFCGHTPEAVVESCAARVEPESLRAAFMDGLFHRPKPRRVTTPLLVLGGRDDATISNREVHATARAYGTQAKLFPRMGHNMMLEPGWRDVADRICGWLGSRGL